MAEKTLSEKLQQNKMMAKFTELAVKFGNLLYLRSLRDAFAVILPVFIIAGLGTLLNSTVFPLAFKGATLARWQVFGNAIANGTLNIAGVLVAPMIGYCLAKNMNFGNPIAAAAMSLACTFIVMPQSVPMTTLAGKSVTVTGGFSALWTGTQGMFGGIIVGLVATSLFVKLGRFKKLRINLGENVPPAVSQSFNVMIPALLLMTGFALFTALLNGLFGFDLISLVKTWIQEPLRGFNTSLFGYCLIYFFANLLFTFGIHQTVLSGSLLDPLVLINMNENMAAVAAHQAIPNIINTSFVSSFTLIGGSGSTLSLIIAILLFSKVKASRQIAGLSLAPGLFNINEPMIFGYPIVFNLPMMIPFVLFPIVGTLIGYYATALGLIPKMTVLVPWVMPPLLGPWLATGGDWRAPVAQALVIVVGVLMYLPFMRISERVTAREAQLARKAG